MKKMYKVIKNKKVFVLENLLTNKLRADKRFYLVQRAKQYLAGIVLGIIIGALIGCILVGNPCEKDNKTSLSLRKQTIEVKAQEVTTPFCYDVITCIRDVGEEMGFSNKDILIAINISRAESGFRSDALGVNTNKSVDRGAMQINSVHKRLSNADAFDYEKNIRFAYQLRKEQGNWMAWSTCHNGKVNCK
jgi:hypothetical protein